MRILAEGGLVSQAPTLDELIGSRPVERVLVTLILGAHDIAALIDGIDVIAAVEAIHADLGTGRMDQPAPPTLAGRPTTRSSCRCPPGQTGSAWSW